MPDWMSQERVTLIKSLGARIITVRRDQGGFLGSIRMTQNWPNKNLASFYRHSLQTKQTLRLTKRPRGRIWWQLFFNSIKPDAFVAGVGTGGTIMGAGKFLRQRNPAIKLHPVQPTESPTLSTGQKVGHHRIQGISDEFIPSILQLENLDSVVSVHDGDAILMAQKLGSMLGLGVGISAGANFIGALMVQNDLGDNAAVTTVFPDDNKKYLAHLLREERAQQHYLAPQVELLSYEAFKRVCYTCFDGEE